MHFKGLKLNALLVIIENCHFVTLPCIINDKFLIIYIIADVQEYVYDVIAVPVIGGKGSEITIHVEGESSKSPNNLKFPQS